MTTTVELLERALAAHRANRVAEAEALYRAVLATVPGHADALHLLGLLELQLGRVDAAIRGIEAAIAIVEGAPAPGHAPLHVNLGNAYQIAGRSADAAASYRRALALDPGLAQAHSNLGNLLQASGDPEGAITCYREAIRLAPDLADAHYNLGNLYSGQRRLDDAIASYREALRCRPAYPEALNNLGYVLQDAGRKEEALACYQAAVAQAPGSVRMHVNLGTALRAAGRLTEAVAAYERALAIDPDDAEAHFNLANARYAAGDPAAARTGYARAIARQPAYAQAHYNLANLEKEAGDPASAIAGYRRALAAQPDFPDALFNLANLLQDQGALDEAIATWQQLLARVPDHAAAQAGLGNGLRQRGDTDGAIAAFERAIALDPRLAEAHYNLANTREDTGDMPGALAAYDAALALRPDYVEARWNRSLVLLRLGDLERGWTEYEWRWRRRQAERIRRPFDAPQWRGMDALAGRRILLHAEQGLGDTLQFCRYVPLVAAHGPAEIILEVPDPLLGLMVDSFGGLGVRVVPLDPQFPRGDSLPGFDLHCPLMSLPLAFGTRLETIPAAVPYLRVNPTKAAAWTARVGDAARPRIGLVWAGGSRENNPEAAATDRRRSIALAQLAPLAGRAGVTWFSLQKGPPAAQAADPPPGLPIIDLMDAVRDFADTAALIAELDLVISVDTSVAHVAAGLGKPVWLLSRFDGCWRWLLERDDTPWYPGMRLYRQDQPGAWSPVIDRLAADLDRWLADRAGRSDGASTAQD